jgi:hypothetical protein
MTTHNQITRSFDTRWDHHYATLQQYANRTGTSRVPAGWKETFGTVEVPLGSWVCAQRNRYRAGHLPPTRAAKLEQVPGWEWGPLNPGPRRDAERNAAIRARRQEGKSFGAIAKEFGLSRQRVHQIVHTEDAVGI